LFLLLISALFIIRARSVYREGLMSGLELIADKGKC
jgi:hypothetical protein